METLTTASTCCHTRIRLTTRRPTEFIDLTGSLDRLVGEAGVRFGVLTVQTLHTTTGVVVNEHEPLLLADFEAFLERMAPRDGTYRHDDFTSRTVNVTAAEPANGHAHCRALLLPSSVSLNIVSGRLLLGQWQRVFLVELDGPRERDDLGAHPRGGRAMKIKMILPALTEATSPFWRPIKYSLFPPLGLATLAGYLGDDADVTIQDEHVEALDLDGRPRTSW